MGDYYKILDLKKTASAKEIKSAYRKLAVKWHPDKNQSPEADEKFKKISEAYGVLSDVDQRNTYDKFGKNGLDGGGGRGGGFGGGVNPNDIFNSFFGGGGGFGGGGFGGGMSFNGMNFSQMPGGGPFGSFMGSRTSSVSRKGPPSKINTTISFSEMFNGCTKKFKVQRNVKCMKCSATGTKANFTKVKCSKCKGAGIINERVQMGPGIISCRRRGCSKCNGEGEIIPDEGKCNACNGLKFTKKTELLEINIPKGVKTKNTILIKNKGDASEKWLEPGDIEICIEVLPSPNKNISRVNNDLHITKKILLREALTGLKLKFIHLDGKKILLHYDEIIKPMELYRVYNLGFENNGKTGDLIIQFNIIFPDELDETRKQLLNKILPDRKNIIDGVDFKQFNLVQIETDEYKEPESDEEQQASNFECAQQ